VFHCAADYAITTPDGIELTAGRRRRFLNQPGSVTNGPGCQRYSAETGLYTATQLHINCFQFNVMCSEKLGIRMTRARLPSVAIEVMQIAKKVVCCFRGDCNLPIYLAGVKCA